jgi:hypothetical protein
LSEGFDRLWLKAIGSSHGRLIGSIIDYLNVDAKSGQVCGQH